MVDTCLTGLEDFVDQIGMDRDLWVAAGMNLGDGMTVADVEADNMNFGRMDLFHWLSGNQKDLEIEVHMCPRSHPCRKFNRGDLEV